MNGEVKGDVHADERIELASQARVIGNVYYKLIEMAIGAEVNGNLVRKSEKDSADYDVSSASEDEFEQDDDYGMKSA